ncbi:MAG: hypothetical protein EA398_02050 [Deltaproteobacteria bacterium]|nr:MAG: hypothetical protein EA398_02050 [Deltaproteobacteria bacterium]
MEGGSDTGSTPARSDVDATGPGNTSGDVGETTSGPGLEHGRLFRSCETDADCPVLGTRCIESLGFSQGTRSWGDAGRLLVADLFESGASGASPRVCSRDCAEDGQVTCDGLVDAAGWTCQVVAEIDIYGEAMLAGEVPDVNLLQAFERGTPFAALCRPPSERLPDGQAVLCDSCTADADCGATGRCIRVALADGSRSAGYCAPPCPAEGCPAGFVCEDAHCVAIAGTCDACRDLDGNGRGVGHCPVDGLDCDDLDPDAYYEAGRAPLVDRCGAHDLNCNGVPDSEELVGPDGLASSHHCMACDSPCTAESIGAATGLPNAGAECVWEDEAAGTAACVPGCQAGFANCDGNDATGCETDLSRNESCGGCGVDCADASLPNVSALTCEDAGGSLDGSGPYACRPAECIAGYGSCDEDWETGCETDVRVTVDHCGECGHRCPERANAIAGCEGGICVIASCRTDFGNCDDNEETGCESDFMSSAEHCGACGDTCLGANVASATCLNGSCRDVQCAEGYDSCDGALNTGCETELASTTAHCGTCGNDCGALPNVASAACSGGDCTILACTEGFRNCDGDVETGCERSVRTLTDCGDCGEACSPPDANLGSDCATGTCVCLDASPIEICDGRRSRCDHVADEGCPADLRSPVTSPTRSVMQGAAEPARCDQGGQNCIGPLANQNHRVVTYGVRPTSGVHCPASGQCPFSALSLCPEPTEPIVGFETHHASNGRVIAVTPIYATFDVEPESATHPGTGNRQRYAVTVRHRDGARYGEPGAEVRSNRLLCTGNQLLTAIDAIGDGTTVHGFRLRCQPIEIRLRTSGLSNPDPIARYTVGTAGSPVTRETPVTHHRLGSPTFRTILAASGVRHAVAFEFLFRQTNDQCGEIIAASAALQFVAVYTRNTLEILP